jgi:hypothetical protein
MIALCAQCFDACCPPCAPLCSVAANRDTFNKLYAYSAALFVLSLASFFVVTRTPVGGVFLRAARMRRVASRRSDLP